jgi:hypothetical protein
VRTHQILLEVFENDSERIKSSKTTDIALVGYLVFVDVACYHLYRGRFDVAIYKKLL